MRMEQGQFGPSISLRHGIYCSFNSILCGRYLQWWKHRIHFADGIAARATICVGIQGEIGLSQGIL